MKKVGHIAIAALAIVVAAVAPARIAAQEPAAVQGPYVIRAVDFSIQGLTLEFVLRKKADIEVGKCFPTKEALEAYLADRKQVLVNQRVLEEVSLDYDAPLSPGGGHDVAVRVSTKDSWNIIGLPYFDYDSNSGLLLSLRGRDYNFLGSMQTLVLNLDWTQDELGRNAYGGYMSCGVPFRLFGHDWSTSLSEDLRIYADGRPAKSGTTAGIGITFPELGPPITLSGTQTLSFNPDSVAADVDPYLLTTAGSLSTWLPLGEPIGKLGRTSYSIGFGASRMWRFDAPVRPDRRSTVLTVSQGLSLGRIDWLGNMQQGLQLSASNWNGYYVDPDSWVVDLDAQATALFTYKGRLGAKLRASGFFRPVGSIRGSLGASLRGVLDARITGDAGAFANLDLPVKLFDFPTHLFIKKDWFDFELQFSPFLDAAVVRPGPMSAIASENLWSSGGFEFLVFPFRVRSFIVRASLGFDLDSVVRNGSFTDSSPRDGYSPYEISFGLGLFY
ncbi:MAG: hypothetical protein Q8M76_17915 [Spirochaetaceae bacterium]|nr:hypothetical protein [Spirochaetaceae bacterium]